MMIRITYGLFVVGLASTAIWNPFWGFVLLAGGFFVADRGFAYFHLSIAGIPFYVTEAVIAGAFLHYTIQFVLRKRPLSLPRLSVHTGAAFFFSVGALQSLGRGLWAKFGLKEIFRDTAMTYYGLLTPLIGYSSPDDKTIHRAGKFLAACLIFRTLYLFLKGTLGMPPLTPEEHNPAAQGMHLSFCLLMAMALYPYWAKKRWWYPIMIMQVCLITLGMVRTTWVALTAGYVVLVFLFWRTDWRNRLVRMSLAIFLTGILSAMVMTSMGWYGEAKLSVLKNEAASFFQGQRANNLMTRVWMWIDAIDETLRITYFSPGDIDLSTAKREFAKNRFIDKSLLNSETITESDANRLTEEQILTALNRSLTRFELNTKLEIPESSQSPEIRALIEIHSKPDGQFVGMKLRKLNRAILEMVYYDAITNKKYLGNWTPAPSVDVFRIGAVSHTITAATISSMRPGVPVDASPVISPDASPTEESMYSRTESKLRHYLIPLFGTPFGKPFLPPRLVYVLTVDRFDPHNSFVAILYRIGLVGFTGFLLIVGSILLSSYRLLRKRDVFDFEQCLMYGFMSCIVYVLAHSCWDVTLENAFKGAFLWILLGALILWGKKIRSSSLEKRSE
ncbi:MAG TPA: hypothetical protein PK876_09000 [Elusimicrobiota bacterium]|nr:hypothetical protein [Elusimicrobiota bacterium]